MKTLLTIILTLVLMPVKSQIYALFQPQWLVTGVMYHQPIKNHGVFIRAQYGNIHYDDLRAGYLKTGIGYSHGKQAKILLGLNYNEFLNVTGFSENLNLNKVKTISFDVGLSVKQGRITGMALTDILNWETTFGISYELKKRECSPSGKTNRSLTKFRRTRAYRMQGR